MFGNKNYQSSHLLNNERMIGMYRESISAIMKANKDDPDLLDFIESRVNSFVDYVGHVTYMETRI